MAVGFMAHLSVEFLFINPRESLIVCCDVYLTGYKPFRFVYFSETSHSSFDNDNDGGEANVQ